MKYLYSAHLALLLQICVSCSDHEKGEALTVDLVPPQTDNINDFEEGVRIDNSKFDELDFESLLSQDSNVVAIDVAGASEINGEHNNLNMSGESVPLDVKISKELEAETALKNLEVNSVERQKSIEDLRKINNKKDQTIASLSLLNDELISEIKRIKGDVYRDAETSVTGLGSGHQLDSLKSEVKKLKNNLALKSEELKSLRYRNDSLEGRISDLELSPTTSKSNLLPIFPSTNSYDSSKVNLFSPKASGQCKLQFEAVVTALNGKSKEAFYTEFFILPTSLENIMRKGGIELASYTGIDTYAELWARSRKNAFLFPDVHKKFRSLLLDFEDSGEGKRIRTDVDGSAFVDGLPAGKYFVIGTASLGKVGVTWSVPVSLNNGNNKISLTLANCSWSL
ncbi:MAG: hypothetical protein P8O23_08575 [Opitutales bacterium]|nr:hypothetical protein [Opitutales bacterium]